MAESVSLSQSIFNKIRSDILTGVYRPGDELGEANLGKQFHASRTPVREALRQLEFEGLVTIVPNKSVIVRGVSVKDVKDIYAIRSRLESLCAGWAAVSATDEQIAKLEETVFLSDFHASRGELEQVHEMDNRFHELLYEASGSTLLAHTLLEFHQYIQAVRKASITNLARTGHSNAEHRAIMEAIKAHDAERAEALTREHIERTLENLKQYDLDAVLHDSGSNT